MRSFIVTAFLPEGSDLNAPVRVVILDHRGRAHNAFIHMDWGNDVFITKVRAHIDRNFDVGAFHGEVEVFTSPDIGAGVGHVSVWRLDFDTYDG